MDGHAFTTMINLPKAGDPSQAQLPEFPRHKLRVVEKLGEGAFGMVSKTLNHYLLTDAQTRGGTGIWQPQTPPQKSHNSAEKWNTADFYYIAGVCCVWIT